MTMDSILTTKAKISLDKRQGTRYNESIKNGIGNQPSLIRVEKKKEIELKKDLDKSVSLGYNESIKNEIGNQPNPFILTEKEMELKKVLDVQLRIRYNEFIKSEEWFIAHHP